MLRKGDKVEHFEGNSNILCLREETSNLTTYFKLLACITVYYIKKSVEEKLLIEIKNKKVIIIYIL